MLYLISIILTLNIYNLEIKTKNYIIFNYKTSSVFSYGFIQNLLPIEHKRSNFFSFENDDLSELFFYNIALDDNKIIENRIYMIENNKNITLNDFKISVNENYEIFEINPKFSIGKSYDNLQKIEVKNIENYSKFIWDEFLQNIINNNKLVIITNIEKILNESVRSLELMFIKYPLLYFYNSIEKIKGVFLILLNIITSTENVKLNEVYNSLKFFCENENGNMIMQRYHLIKGQEISNESRIFFFSCLLTDIYNIYKYFNTEDKYIFKIFNIIECKNLLYGEFWIGCEINLEYKEVKIDCENQPIIFIYDNNNNEFKEYITVNCNDKFFVMLNKVKCLNNSSHIFKIIIHTHTKIYETQYLDLKQNIYD